MYIAKLKDGPERVKKTFSMILNRIFEVEVSFSSQNVNSPLFEETLGAFLSLLFLLLRLLRTWVF
jgi:hypothetical protein